MGKYSNELIAAAEKLSVGNPSEAFIRRAVSTYYYAVFHLLTMDGCGLLFADPELKETYTRLASRSIDHRTAYVRLKELTQERRPSDTIGQNSVLKIIPEHNMDLKKFANNFIDLQDKRHSADYDLSKHFDSGDTFFAALQAGAAIAAFDRLKSDQPKQIKQLIASILFSEKIKLI